MTITPLAWLDSLSSRVSMYRHVTLTLVALVVAAFALSDEIGPATFFTGSAMARSLVVLVAASVGSSLLFGLVFRVRPQLESAVITALLLWFLYWPQSEPKMLAWLGAVAVLATASKYLLAFRRRHIFNPAAAGAVLMLVVQELLGVDPLERQYATWWVATEPMLPYVAVGAVLVLWRTRRLGLGATFVGIGGGLLVLSMTSSWAVLPAVPIGDAVESVLQVYPLVFLAGFMLSEPLTLPPRGWQRLVVAAVAAVFFAWPVFAPMFLDEPLKLWIFTPTPEVALVVANLVAFAFGQRRGVRLRLVRKREIAASTWEFGFEPARPVRFQPGQYVELQVPHSRADGRGTRRFFSISSAPGSEILTVAVRVPANPSSYKRAMLGLEVGDMLTATGVSGDFVLPSNPARPVLLVAGGIGITPFVGQLSGHTDRDAVLAYGVPDGNDVAYRDELAATGARVVLVSPNLPDDLPAGWSHVPAPVVRGVDLADVVPDLRRRRVYASGPPRMVRAVKKSLRRHAGRIRTDYFTGY